jgi:hypothetical protein
MELGTRSQELIQLGIERRTPPPLSVPQLTSDEKLKQVLGACATLAGYGTTVVAIVLLVLSAWLACSRYSLLSSWVRTDAEILNGVVYSDFIHTESRAQTQFRPVFGFRCTVRYQAKGRLYESPADIGYEKAAKSEMINWFLRFPAGSHTTIAYDPVNPGRVVLAEDLRTSYAGALTTLGYAAWLLLFGLPLLLISWQWRRQVRTALDHDRELAP